KSCRKHRIGSRSLLQPVYVVAAPCFFTSSWPALDVRGQPLGHLDFSAVVDRPRCLVRHRLDQSGRGGVAVAALLDAAERQMHLGADARQIDVAHTVLALLAE